MAEEQMNILVTGGAGYVGSHVVRELMETDHGIITVDNLQKGHEKAVLGGEFYHCDLADKDRLEEIFTRHNVDAVIHLAADSLVGESMDSPHKYYDNNICAGLVLLDIMLEHGVDKFVFSSTAAVYGEPENLPINEEDSKDPTNPYGRSKLFYEEILGDYQRAYDFDYISLRYFNASGAHPSGEIGENHEPETHLIPLVLQTALGQREALEIYGTNYDTRDGTCIRDYIHVSDLARAHILAVEELAAGGESAIYNLGSGDGFSVREVIESARKVTGKNIPAEPADPRPGDPPRLIASSSKIKKELGWQRHYTDLEEIIDTAWKWHSQHPQGFADK